MPRTDDSPGDEKRAARPGYRFRTPPRMRLELTPAARPVAPVAAVSAARRLWGGVVLGIGGLWLAGGTAGLLTGQRVPWIMPLLGLVLVRLGWGLRRGSRP